jgi:hypothetical protein
MNRRNFLASLAAVAVLDPEKLLWIRGEKTIFIPPAPAIVAPWGPIIGINLEATREAGRFHNGLRGHGDSISVVQYSELDEGCRLAFNEWLRMWRYPIPTKENPTMEPPAVESSFRGIIAGTWPLILDDDTRRD